MWWVDLIILPTTEIFRLVEGELEDEVYNSNVPAAIAVLNRFIVYIKIMVCLCKLQLLLPQPT